MSTFSAKSIPVSPMRLIAVTLLLLLSTFTLGVPTAQAAGTVTDCTTFGYTPGTLGFVLFGGGGTITFECSGTIVVPSEITIGSDTVFDATGYNVTLDGNGATRVIHIQSGNVTLRHLTIANGNASVGGGAWVQSGSLTVEHSTFTGNTATGGGGGGVYLQSGSLTVEHSTFTGNTATTEGGAILSGGTLIIANSVITGNSTGGDGGGVHTGVNSNDTTINDSTISGNTAGQRGGGIALDSGFATISRSTISGNSAQAQSRPEGGGGVFVANYMTASIFNSTISGNTSATTGGGLVAESDGQATLINSTVTANHANTSGGGIRHVNDNTAAKITLDNTIVAGNTASVDGPDMSGQIVSANYNLIGSTAGATFAPQANDITGQDALLGPLADNGGPTQTHALQAGSPAINAGSTSLPTDQRNFVRPAGAADDIGAYEYDATPLAIILASFDAQAQAGHVLATWETVSELDTAGFNLYRTTTADPPTVTDLLTFVPSQGPGSAQGFFYSHEDYDVMAGQTYWYWLEDVDLSGVMTLHGPVNVTFAGPTAVTLSGLKAAAGGPAPQAWPWFVAALAAVLAAAVARRRTIRL